MTRRPHLPAPADCLAPGILRSRVAALALLLAMAAPADIQAQQDHAHGQHASPYSDMVDRDIKALSEEDVEGLLGGMGMQMALAAELNGYPGPRHVLDMADMLGLTEETRADVQEVFDRMQAQARALGAELVEAERVLDARFADGTIDSDELDRLVGDIARLRGQLRIVHLSAHLSLWPLLTPDQRDHYSRARGYPGSR